VIACQQGAAEEDYRPQADEREHVAAHREFIVLAPPSRVEALSRARASSYGLRRHASHADVDVDDRDAEGPEDAPDN
jgi:hypothetical protein